MYKFVDYVDYVNELLFSLVVLESGEILVFGCLRAPMDPSARLDLLAQLGIGTPAPVDIKSILFPIEFH